MIKKIYFTILRIVAGLPLEKMASRVFFIPDYIFSGSLLFISLIICKIINIKIDFPKGLMLFIGFQVVSFILFSQYRPTDREKIKEIRIRVLNEVTLTSSLCLISLIVAVPLLFLVILY